MIKSFIDKDTFPRFELVADFQGQSDLLPTRATKNSAGYDFVVAQDTIVSAFSNYFKQTIFQTFSPSEKLDISTVSNLSKDFNCRPTLVPTGVKVYMPKNQFLQISVRSSCPLKYWLILANGVGIIDADYYNNPDNEGHIYFQMINLFPVDIVLKRGDKIGQGIFLNYNCTLEGDTDNLRAGGFGSTTE